MNPRRAVLLALVWTAVVAVGSTLVWTAINGAGRDLVTSDAASGSVQQTPGGETATSGSRSGSDDPGRPTRTHVPPTSTGTTGAGPSDEPSTVVTSGAPSSPSAPGSPPSAPSSPSSPSTSTPSSAGGGTPDPTSSPQPVAIRRTWQGEPGTVVAECRGSRISFVGAQPNSGWTVQVDNRGPDEIEVHLRSSGGDDGSERERAADDEVEVRAHCTGGSPSFAVG